MSLGDSKPTAPNEMEEGRQKNRRVEIVLYTTEADSPEEPSQARTLSTDSPHLSASGSNNLPSPSTPASDTGSSATRGTLSFGDSAQTGPSSPGTPDASSPSVTMESNRPETSQQQPASGTPTE